MLLLLLICLQLQLKGLYTALSIVYTASISIALNEACHLFWSRILWRLCCWEFNIFIPLNDPYNDGTIEYWRQFILPFSNIKSTRIRYLEARFCVPGFWHQDVHKGVYLEHVLKGLVTGKWFKYWFSLFYCWMRDRYIPRHGL